MDTSWSSTDRARTSSLITVLSTVECSQCGLQWKCWIGVARLDGFAPRDVQESISARCGLRGPQLASWLKSLNLTRNVCAHHGRLFNRVHTLTPKLPKVGVHPDLDGATTAWNRTFAQLTLIQFLLNRLGLGRSNLLPAVVRSYPTIAAVPLSHLGAAEDWQTASQLWAS